MADWQPASTEHSSGKFRGPEASRTSAGTQKSDAPNAQPASTCSTRLPVWNSASSSGTTGQIDSVEWDLLAESFDRIGYSTASLDAFDRMGSSAASADALPKEPCVARRGVAGRELKKLASSPPTVACQVTSLHNVQKLSSEPPRLHHTVGHLPDQPAGPRCHVPSCRERDGSFHDRYEVFRLCGKGRSARVRHARHLATGWEFVVRTCRKITMGNPLWQVLLHGTEVHSCLRHPHIVKMEDLHATTDVVHMVLPRLEGTLQEELKDRGRFSEDQASYVIRQVLNAVDYLHEQHIAHRDISLENIMLKKEGNLEVQLVGFDFATRWDGLDKLSLRCGRKEYAAPEILQGAYDEKADVWSVGVVAHMLLTGESVRSEQGCVMLSEKLKDRSAKAASFVQALLHPDPVQRASAEEALNLPWL